MTPMLARSTEFVYAKLKQYFTHNDRQTGAVVTTGKQIEDKIRTAIRKLVIKPSFSP